MLTEIQKEKFFELSGKEYDGNSESGEFLTEFPYNNREWKYSPWMFKYQIDQSKGYLYCELSHRMTNNRMHGYDKLGDELPYEVVLKVYPNTEPFL